MQLRCTKLPIRRAESECQCQRRCCWARRVHVPSRSWSRVPPSRSSGSWSTASYSKPTSQLDYSSLKSQRDRGATTLDELLAVQDILDSLLQGKSRCSPAWSARSIYHSRKALQCFLYRFDWGHWSPTAVSWCFVFPRRIACCSPIDRSE